MRLNKTRLSRMPETQSAPIDTLGTETPHRSGKCGRCGGFLVDDQIMGLDTMGSERRSRVWAMRCVQCGDMIDETILRNRYFPHYVLQEDKGERVEYSEEELPCIR
jgi:hypothetical protein